MHQVKSVSIIQSKKELTFTEGDRFPYDISKNAYWMTGAIHVVVAQEGMVKFKVERDGREGEHESEWITSTSPYIIRWKDEPPDA